MKKFVVERNLPGGGNLSPQQLQTIHTACEAISHDADIILNNNNNQKFKK